jgi:hypothetical protein
VESSEWLDRIFSAQPEAVEFVGLSEQEALDAAKSSNLAARVIRVGATLPLHMDHRGDRVNLVVEGDRVLRAAYF